VAAFLAISFHLRFRFHFVPRFPAPQDAGGDSGCDLGVPGQNGKVRTHFPGDSAL
jgi:hypothetical protein